MMWYWPVFGEVGPEPDDVEAQLPLCVVELFNAAVDGHLVGEASAERRAEDVVQLDRVETVAGRREVVLVDVGAVHGDQIRHLVARGDHVHVGQHLPPTNGIKS